ncbi:CheR family methyltransferase [Tahibacter amnicola]|uniref:protein-glutamate O-methyltransferase n=1 Tax=Tahibacter amnicola TaxID=2976241 RepID=A0ABY6BAG0_9GAMM|nr:CheR family methyltransferase [Tahibacter amnicola]UXI66654.1 methyltransferase domain-containing protein [Tahibacter amnicola]
MKVLADPGEAQRLRAIVERDLGLLFEESKMGLLDAVLQRRARAAGCSVTDYLDQLERISPRDETLALAQELTVSETYFFRHVEQFQAFVGQVLPDRMHWRGSGRRLSLLSAGCASGEEPYTLAMHVKSVVPEPEWQVSILGVDINPHSLAKARQGRYSAWALRSMAPADRQRWFRKDGSEFVLDDRVRNAVRFDQRNLVAENPDLWRDGEYDVIFCRNVLMYFSPEQAQELIARLTRALAPGGYLFLGHAETLRGLSQDFHLHHTHDTFYYQRREREAESTPPSPYAAREFIAPATEPPETWMDAIGQASERIRRLTDEIPAAAAPPPFSPRLALAAPLAMLGQERYADALELINSLVPDARSDPDVRLLQAVLLAHAGQWPAAEAASARLLEQDDLNAGAHYVLALCAEAAGDLSRACGSLEVAAYLDPTFAMPRLHRGLIARRMRDGETARRELTRALGLLQHEDGTRLLLFGGGFNRNALVTLCRSELDALPGAAA